MANSSTREIGVSLRRLFPEAQMLGAPDIQTTCCTSDSRSVKPGDLFVALPGISHDGHEFAHDAVRRGATAVLAERYVPVDGRPLCLVDDVRPAYGRLCQALAGSPADRLRMIGVTGTNGKTTTTALIAAVLKAAGRRAGTLGTLGVRHPFGAAPTTHTTPPPETLAMALAELDDVGCQDAVMEVSSHGLSQQRIAGLAYDAICYTNIRRDHLDFHGSLVNYRGAKARLLDYRRRNAPVILNLDDPHTASLASRCADAAITYSLRGEADLTATLLDRSRSEQTYLLSWGRESIPVCSHTIGDHQISNSLAAAAVGLALGVELTDVVRGLESVEYVPGRLQRVECGQPFGVFVDYAHTPDALEACLTTLREVTSGRLFCVFGAAGRRDPRSRALMGATVEQHADVAVVTTDDPRGESPAGIVRDILDGCMRRSTIRQVADRCEAITQTLAEAMPGDTVVIAGRGHEQVQRFDSGAVEFDDFQVAREVLYQLQANLSYV